MNIKSLLLLGSLAAVSLGIQAQASPAAPTTTPHPIVDGTSLAYVVYRQHGPHHRYHPYYRYHHPYMYRTGWRHGYYPRHRVLVCWGHHRQICRWRWVP